MTAQFADRVRYLGDDYNLAGVNGTGLFDPAAHGVKASGMCSACWRGSVCGYAVEGDALVLDKLSVVGGPDPADALLFGVAAVVPDEKYALFGVYERLRHPVPYTGGLLIGTGFIDELYVHMGFHPAWKYRTVHELVFRDGRLEHAADKSADMAGFRDELRDRPLGPGGDVRRADIKGWIEKCFSQDYKW